MLFNVENFRGQLHFFCTQTTGFVHGYFLASKSRLNAFRTIAFIRTLLSDGIGSCVRRGS